MINRLNKAHATCQGSITCIFTYLRYSSAESVIGAHLLDIEKCMSLCIGKKSHYPLICFSGHGNGR